MSLNHRKSLLPSGGTNAPLQDKTTLTIGKIEAKRHERRHAARQFQEDRAAEDERNVRQGRPGDVDFQRMVATWRQEHQHEEQSHHDTALDSNICICVRKRPVSVKEQAKKDHDSVTCLHPNVWIHSAKFKVDGITKYLDHSSFRFDHAFDEHVATETVYEQTTLPLLDFVCAGQGGRATVFAYGQTGSGKTYTMNGIQSLLCEDLYAMLHDSHDGVSCSIGDTRVMLSFFEMYAGGVQDLLSDKGQRLKVLEDGKGEVVVHGLSHVEAPTPETFMEILTRGNQARTTHRTEANDTSSRSHAICQVMLLSKSTTATRTKAASLVLRGKLSLVDLAGSERGADTKNHNAQRRMESADINTSLLSLKECIRALDKKTGSSKANNHVPYRGSKLTMVLKDCFTSPNAMTTMIATISPGASAADHSLNTLRYADRIKEQRVAGATTTTTTQRKRPARVRSKVSPKPMPSAGPTGSNASIKASLRATAVETSDSRDSQGGGEEVTLQQHEAKQRTVTAPKRTTSTAATSSTSRQPARSEEQTELRQRAQSLLQQEDAILSKHMGYIQENAELLAEEVQLLREVQRPGATDEDIEAYLSALESVLERKEDMILDLQDMLYAFTLKSD